MEPKQSKNLEDNKHAINSAVARVSGAVRVASATVAETLTIKDEALDDVAALRTNSNSKERDQATKQIEKDTKKVTGKGAQ